MKCSYDYSYLRAQRHYAKYLVLHKKLKHIFPKRLRINMLPKLFIAVYEKIKKITSRFRNGKKANVIYALRDWD